MKGLSKKSPLLLFFGDAVMLILSLWITLSIRYWSIPDRSFFLYHLEPFSYIFAVWLLVYFIMGLYDRNTLTFSKEISSEILNAQLINSFIAIAFFYLVPKFIISPKTILFLDLIISFILIFLWRIYILKYVGIRKKAKAIFIGSGSEMEELKDVISESLRSEIEVVKLFDTTKSNDGSLLKDLLSLIKTEKISTIVVDFYDKKILSEISGLYNLIFSGIRFLDVRDLYESYLGKVPLSLVKHDWFLENISFTSGDFYGFFRRIFDVLFSFIVGMFFVILLPFVSIAIKIEDGGPVFYINKRLGQRNKEIKIVKFRSMSVSESEKVTKVGSFLRKTRIDEIPQVLNVLVGDLSFIGPRPEKPNLAFMYESEIPFYNVRHLVKPGLSGWAQIYQDNPPKFGLNVEDTKTKLSYDLYYIKNRSLLLDIKIALRTIKTLLLRTGK